MSWILLLSTSAIITYHRIISQPFRFTTDLKVNEISLQIDTFLSKTIIFSAHRVTKSIYFFKNNITNELQMIDIVVMKLMGLYYLKVSDLTWPSTRENLSAAGSSKCTSCPAGTYSSISGVKMLTLNPCHSKPVIWLSINRNASQTVRVSAYVVLGDFGFLINLQCWFLFLVLNSTGLSSPICIVCPAGTYSIVLGN